jgi:hypothetical protein
VSGRKESTSKNLLPSRTEKRRLSNGNKPRNYAKCRVPKAIDAFLGVTVRSPFLFDIPGPDAPKYNFL